jgi:hypothetical protein
MIRTVFYSYFFFLTLTCVLIFKEEEASRWVALPLKSSGKCTSTTALQDGLGQGWSQVEAKLGSDPLALQIS